MPPGIYGSQKRLRRFMTSSPKSALEGIRQSISSIPPDNIASMVKGAFDAPGDKIALWYGEGDIATPAFVGEAAEEAIRAGQTFYTDQNGTPELRAALAQYHSKLLGKQIGADQITITSGGMPAIMLAVQILVGEGDNVVVIDPVWPNLGNAVRVVGAVVRSVKMDLGNGGWSIDTDRVAAACDARTRLIFYASPGNPTGAIIPLATLSKLLELARGRGVWIIADEVYVRMAYGQLAAPSILELTEPEDRVIAVNSFSKSWAMTGWRLGWAVHPPSLSATLAMMTKHTSNGTATFLQHAGVSAIQKGEQFVGWMRDYCAAGVKLVCSALESMSRVRIGARPNASMYVLFEVDGMPDSRSAFVEIFERTGVGLAPGAFFGPGSESFFRICACRDTAVLQSAMDRLRPMLS